MTLTGAVAALALMLLPVSHAVAASTGELDAFARQFAARHGGDAAWALKVLSQARVQQAVRDAFTRTAESKPWFEYRKIFVTDTRIAAGKAFLERHASVFARAEERYGVPAPIVAAIIGVETFFGTHAGKYRVLDSLVSLAFHDWRRKDFFASELEQFLLLARDGNVDPLTVKGSYAGAMGYPQFIASSYRAYAVDFDGDGKRDLLDSAEDAIGSVAAYLARHGWQRGQSVAAPLAGSVPANAAPFQRGKRPEVALGRLREQGLRSFAALPPTTLAMVLDLDASSGAERWVVLTNFYVITRYNHSALYAMAVHQIATELRGP